MGFGGQMSQPIVENPVGFFYLMIPLHFHLLTFSIISIMDAWVVLLVLGTEHEHVGVVHGLRQVLVPLNSRHEHLLIMVLSLLVNFQFINKRVPCTLYLSMHF